MAAVEDEVDDRFKDLDIETILSRVQRRPLTFSRKKTVLKAPEFVRRLSGEETVDEGSDLTLHFKVKGLPTPTLRWFKDDEEVGNHPRLSVEQQDDGGYLLTLYAVNKGDEAAYRCRAENSEGSSSCCFFLSVKAKPKSPKRDGKMSPNKRTVSYPTMFSTIVEKVEEEEKAGWETAQAPESPLSHFYDSLSMKSRSTWPSFLGDWAFVNGTHKARGGSTGSYCSTGSEADVGECEIAEGWQSDDVFADSPEKSGQDLELATPSPVLCLQERRPGAQRVGTVPKDVDRPPEEAATRGDQILTPVFETTSQQAAFPISTSSTEQLDSATSTDQKPDSTTSTSQKPGAVTSASQEPDSTTVINQKPAEQIPGVAVEGESERIYTAEKDVVPEVSVPRKPAECSRLKGLASTLTPLHMKPGVRSPLKMQAAEKADKTKVTNDDSNDSLDSLDLPVRYRYSKQLTPANRFGVAIRRDGDKWVMGMSPSSLDREEREPTPIPPDRPAMPQRAYSSHVSAAGQSAASAPFSRGSVATARLSSSWHCGTTQEGSDVDEAQPEDSVGDLFLAVPVAGGVSQVESSVDFLRNRIPSWSPSQVPSRASLMLPVPSLTRVPSVSEPQRAPSDLGIASPPEPSTSTAAESHACTHEATKVIVHRSRQAPPCSVRVKAARMHYQRQARERRLTWQEIGDFTFVICLLTFVALFFDVPPNQFVLLVAAASLMLFFLHRLRRSSQ